MESNNKLMEFDNNSVAVKDEKSQHEEVISADQSQKTSSCNKKIDFDLLKTLFGTFSPYV